MTQGAQQLGQEIELGGSIDSVGAMSLSHLDVLDRKNKIQLRSHTLWVALTLFVLNSLGCLGLFLWKAIALHGMLSERELLYLAGATASCNATILVISVKFIFSKK